MKTFKKIISIIMIAAVIASIAVVSTVSSGAASTGVGLSEWAMRAYNEGWTYVWGGSSVGAVDCSGLIWSYCGGNRTSMLSDAQSNGRDWGYVSNGIPNIHGLGLSRPGHVGVYVGNGMEVDARGTGYNVCYQAVGSSWDCWFKLTAVSYPTTGWQQFNGDYYYYENGEYLTDTSRTIDGETYYFSSSGVSSNTPSSTSSSSSSSSSSSASDDSGALKLGSSGKRVEKLQTRLQELGYYNGVIDGDFGAMTETAFKLFQKTAGLYVDGIAGSDTDLLYSDEAPYYQAEEAETSSKKKTELADTSANTDEAETAEAESADEAVMSYALGDYDEEIIPIQERLISLEYLDGSADGNYGEKTENAVKSFQDVSELEVTGVVDTETYDALFADDAVKNPVDKAEAQRAAAVAATTAKKTANIAIVAPAANTAGPIVNTANVAAPNTEVEKTTTALSSKSIAGITDNIGVQNGAATTNLEFILWLAIMIVVMLITFSVVYVIEKKKSRTMAHAVGRRFQ